MENLIHNDSNEASKKTITIQVAINGPLLISPPVIIKDSDGKETLYEKNVALCRCGASQNKPYCDGSHRKINFNG